ncbi:hypothetical protein GCM10010156_03040 [Planobispora rosea]|uniref:Uncharacterized protein n=1 Tax=Planobispora rosea TaxID=35762 RepID=A0A8J3S1Z8_PLARO|nr:hypothetical protein [Planobispora rosea]GGS47670.1 hypothetical protein GCM10010156_03040 [Planobispora rosea]GIH82183.1 hypothetical protein Pro02_05910 [Planobispora rosea]
MSHDFGTSTAGAYGAPGPTPPAHPYGTPASPGPGSPPRTKTKVKPSLGWIAGAWLLAVLSAGAVVAVAIGNAFGAVDDATPSSSFASYETVTVRLDPEDDPAVYVSDPEESLFNCAFQGDSAQRAQLVEPAVITTIGDEGTRWRLGRLIDVEQAGDYQLLCVANNSAARFGMGRQLSDDSLLSVKSFLILAAVPVAGFLLAIIVTIVVPVKRSRARKRAGQLTQAN